MASLTDKLAPARWAKQTLERDPVILDTETTGLQDGEVIQIAVVATSGAVLLDTLVKPVYRIPPDAIRIHGINDRMVQTAPDWAAVAETLAALLNGRDVIVYNSEYDRRIIRRSCYHSQITEPDWGCIWHCAMKAYAQFHGDWNDYRRSYAWQKLTVACAQQNIPDPDAPAHSALGDCLRTLALMRKMAEANV